MGAHLVRSFLGPENDRSFGARFFTDLNSFTRPTPKHKSRQSKNLGHENDGSHGGSQHGSGRRACDGIREDKIVRYEYGWNMKRQTSLAGSFHGAVGRLSARSFGNTSPSRCGTVTVPIYFWS